MATNWPNSVQTFTNPSPGDSLNSPSHADQHATVNDTVEALQNYAGLVHIKTVNVGSAVSSVTISDAFSSTFSNYRVLISNVAGSADLLMRFGTSSSLYYGALDFYIYNGTHGNRFRNAQSDMVCGILDNGGAVGISFDVHNPNRPVRKTINGTYTGGDTSGWFGFFQVSTTQYTSFLIFPSTGTMTGGTIRVYGYNNGA